MLLVERGDGLLPQLSNRLALEYLCDVIDSAPAALTLCALMHNLQLLCIRGWGMVRKSDMVLVAHCTPHNSFCESAS